jgi:hypothetical protein
MHANLVKGMSRKSKRHQHAEWQTEAAVTEDRDVVS